MSERTRLTDLATIVSDVIEPNAVEIDRDAKFPREALESMGRSGLLGLVSAEAVGGSGGGLREASEVVREIGRPLRVDGHGLLRCITRRRW